MKRSVLLRVNLFVMVKETITPLKKIKKEIRSFTFFFFLEESLQKEVS